MAEENDGVELELEDNEDGVRGGVDHLARRAESGVSGRDAPGAVRARSS